MIEQTDDDLDGQFAYGKDDPAIPEILEFWNFKTCVLCGRDVQAARIMCESCRTDFNAISSSRLRRQLTRNLWQQIRMMGLFTTTDLPTILFNLIKTIHDLYGFDRTGAYLVDNDGRRIRGIGFMGLPKHYIENFDIPIEADDPADKSGYGLIRRVAQTGERVIVNDRSGDPQYQEFMARKESGSPLERTPAKCIAVFPLPSQSRNKVLGMVSVSNLPTNPNPEISSDKVAMLELLLSYASLSIQTAKHLLDQARAAES